VIFEVKVNADAPHGVSWDNKKHTGKPPSLERAPGKEKVPAWDMQKVLKELGEDTSEPRNGKKGKTMKTEKKTKSAVKKEAKMKTIDSEVVESVVMAEVKEKTDEKRKVSNSETYDLNMNKEDAQ